MSHFQVSKSRTRLGILAFLILGLCFGLVGQSLFKTSYSLDPGRRSLYLSTNESGATAEYQIGFYPNVSAVVGSVEFQFCSNDPLPGTPCTPPVGFDASSAVLVDQTGQIGFTISSISSSNRIVLTRVPSMAVAGSPTTYHFTGIINPSSSGTYYARLQAFASVDATGSASDFGGIAFIITNLLSITATVPPYLTFCTGITITGLSCSTASGNYIDFGELSPQQTGKGSSQMIAATNAQDGYNITLEGNTLASGNNTIQALTGGDVSRPGTPQFGLNFAANSSPSVGANPIGPGLTNVLPSYGQANTYKFNPGDTIITNSKPDDVRQYTASYIVNVPATQSPGIYVSTVTYICLATF